MTTLTATQSTFDAQLAKMAPGDTLQVTGPFSGRNGGRMFSSPTTIDFRQAVVSDFFSGGWGRCNFLGGRTIVGPQYFTGMRIEGAEDCQFTGFDMDGTTDPKSGFDTNLWLNGGKNLTVDTIKINGGQSGIRCDAVTGLILRNLDIQQIYEDAIKINDGWNLLIEKFKLWNFAALRPEDHPDGIQIGSSMGRAISTDITVQDGEIAGSNGQGFFAAPYGEGASEGPGFDRVKALRLKIEAGMPRGITIAKCPNWAIEDCSVKTKAGAQWQATITNTGPNRKRNIVTAYTDPTGYTYAEVRDSDYVAGAPAPTPSPSPAPAPTPTPPATKPKPRTMKATITGSDGAIYTGTLTEKLA